MNTQVTQLLQSMNFSSIEEAHRYCLMFDIDPKQQVLETQPIAFDNACDAYTLGTALALQRQVTKAEEAAIAIGEGLQAFCKQWPRMEV